MFVFGNDTLRDCYRFIFRFTESIPDIGPWEELFAPNIGFVEGEMVSLGSQNTTLIEAFIEGRPVSVSPKDDTHTVVPQDFSLEKNYPNPFNGTTRIKYEIKTASNIKTSLKIYNLIGQKLKTLVEKSQLPGIHEAIWDGKDNKEHDAPSGIYLYVLTVGKKQKANKLILVR